MKKYCKYCDEWKDEDGFRGETGKQCRDCIRARRRKYFRTYQKNNRQKISIKGKKYVKRAWLELAPLFGGCCQKCGYSKSVAAFQFHHINPKEKKKGPDWAVRQRDLIELTKCILLCANCHEEHKAGVWDAIFRKRANGYGYEIERITQGN